MDALINSALLAGLIFLMLRMRRDNHFMEQLRGVYDEPDTDQRQSPVQLRWVPPATDIDPVCGKTVHTEWAKPTVFDGMVYYLCSRDCRERFEAAPHLYVGPGSGPHPRQPDHAPA